MEANSVKRVVLVPRRAENAPAPVGVRRRFSLARVGPSPISALGADRFERMEQIASMDGDQPDRREP